MPSLRRVSADSPDAVALLEEYFAHRRATFPDNAYRTVFPTAEVFTPPAGVFLVLDDDAGVASGCGGIRMVADGPVGPRAEVKHLFVRDTGRGQGWGRLLLEGLHDAARDLGAVEAVLDTHHTLTAAGRLYAATGYAEIAPYNDNANATRWYARPL